jgi:hypothetical protein
VSGVDLVAGSSGTVTATAPGTTVTAPNAIVVTNQGDTAANGFTLTIDFIDPGVVPAGHALDGCASSELGPGATRYVCTVNQSVAAGGTYTWPAALAVDLTADVFGAERQLAYTVAPLEGTTDANTGNNTGFFTMELPVDLQAVGGAVTGQVGDTLDMPVGLKNLGPFALGQMGSEGNDPVVKLTVPVGVAVVGVPTQCDEIPSDGDQPQYACDVYRMPPIAVGASRLFTFKVKITGTSSAVRAPAGAVGLSLGLLKTDPKTYVGSVTVLWAADANTENNHVEVTVTPAAPNTLPTTGVAITGYVVGGLLLIGVGVAFLVFTRTRARTHVAKG